ncbi:MAG: hypothetical protein GC146_03685 [Limimaricola sp.]|uniref:hypothetical protein n=1 Tax=Limimaricola sp. TaxID=2211665 RepID=UPI001D433962|nr:hypothetical protein [Limimaricola sp.]MBI1416302.1 hypothetical protein [Limimaricola sp.]
MSISRICFAVGAFMLVAVQAQAGCLSIVQNGIYSAWQNNCNRQVYVTWDDQGYCDWDCGEWLGPYDTVSAGIEGRVNWCEYYDGASGGPC